MPDYTQILHYAAETVKIVGGLASLYAVIKIRQIEKKYLFKATIPELIQQIQNALDDLNRYLSKPSDHRLEVAKALNHLIVDCKNIRRKARGDSLHASRQLLESISRTRPSRYPWQREAPMVLNRAVLIEVYGKGMGLIRSLENDLEDQGWSRK